MLFAMKYNLHILIAFQSLMFLLVLASPPFNKLRHNIYLVFFFLFQTLAQSSGILTSVSQFNSVTCTTSESSLPLFNFPSFPFSYLVIPFLYLYVLKVTDRSFRLKPLHALHATPFVGVLSFIAFEFFTKGITGLIAIAQYGSALYIRQEYYNFRVLLIAQIYFYLLLCFRRLTYHNKYITQVYSSIDEVDLNWLRFFLYFLGIWSLVDALPLIVYRKNYALYPYTYIFSSFVYLFVMTIVFIRSLSQREMIVPVPVQNERKYEKNQLSDNERERYLKILLDYMESDKPYLKPEITIKDISSGTNIQTHIISQILNTNLNQNFYDFINSYRISESQRLLTTKMERPRTIIEVLFESGFNSKSTFNAAFKKHTGMTPSQFKERGTIPA